MQPGRGRRLAPGGGVMPPNRGMPDRGFNGGAGGGGMTAPGVPDNDLGTGDILGTETPPANDKATPQEEEVQVPEYLLLRYFDFDIKPNKQYQYRVFLVLDNPNWHLDASLLEDPDDAQRPYVAVIGDRPKKNAAGVLDWPTNPKYAEWSQPCISSRVPGDMRLLGGNVLAPRNPQEITAEARVLKWLKESGSNSSFAKDNLVRGTILNFPDATLKIPGGGKTTQNPLSTDCILVDIQGGEPLPTPKDKSPGMILVMDDTGNLVMHDQVAEAKEWEDATKEPERQDQRRTPDRAQPRPRGERRLSSPDSPDIEIGPVRRRPSGGR